MSHGNSAGFPSTTLMFTNGTASKQEKHFFIVDKIFSILAVMIGLLFRFSIIKRSFLTKQRREAYSLKNNLRLRRKKERLGCSNVRLLERIALGIRCRVFRYEKSVYSGCRRNRTKMILGLRYVKRARRGAGLRDSAYEIRFRRIAVKQTAAAAAAVASGLRTTILRAS